MRCSNRKMSENEKKKKPFKLWWDLMRNFFFFIGIKEKTCIKLFIITHTQSTELDFINFEEKLSK